jgi:hypothetical protein
MAHRDRWDALRQAKIAFANADYAGVMRTGVVCRKSIGSGSNAQVVEEYEINTALIESLNSLEKRAATETGQEVSDTTFRSTAS